MGYHLTYLLPPHTQSIDIPRIYLFHFYALCNIPFSEHIQEEEEEKKVDTYDTLIEKRLKRTLTWPSL